MRHNYANAKEILPRKLFEKIQEHYTGNLYIPSGKPQAAKNMALRLAASGASNREIEIVTGLTRRRINQIRAEYRERSLSCG